jgi:hypothetical protein
MNDDLLYNRYYRFIRFKNEYGIIYRSDAGMEQWAFQLLEDNRREESIGSYS